MKSTTVPTVIRALSGVTKQRMCGYFEKKKPKAARSIRNRRKHCCDLHIDCAEGFQLHNWSYIAEVFGLFPDITRMGKRWTSCYNNDDK